MRRRWVAALVVAALLLGSSGAPADPSNWGQLAQIVLWLKRIDGTLKDINDLVDGADPWRPSAAPCPASSA
jgi:hypothetical protein